MCALPRTPTHMHGPTIIAASLNARRHRDQYDNEWQYSPWSNHHSKVCCWAILFDVLRTSSLLRRQVREGKVGFGINHQMVDFETQKHKDLDLVLCIPRSDASPTDVTFHDLRLDYDLVLSRPHLDDLQSLPPLKRTTVGDVLLAAEAKACMTEHSKAGSRFYDELSSAAQCINGSAARAIAIGFALFNAADRFISPKRNPFPMGTIPARITEHHQPKAVRKIEATFRKLRLRRDHNGRGFDTLGAVTIRMENNLSPVELVTDPPALSMEDPYHYEMMVRRIVSLYENRFASL